MKHMFLKLTLGLLLITAPFACKQASSSKKAVTDTVEQRAERLLEQMTLKEKIGQMTQICFSEVTETRDKTLRLDEELFREVIAQYQVGSFLSGTGNAAEWKQFLEKVQKTAVEESRLGIPLLIAIDHVHGSNYIDEGTIFPHNILMSCSFDTSLMARAARVTARETAPLGLSWNFAPVMDLGKNPYWPRFYETFGEDPLVCGAMGAAFVRAYQAESKKFPSQSFACGKHFIGYSDPETGWDRTPADVSDQTMAEYFMPAFQQAIDAGLQTMMVNSGEVNGRPVHASKRLLDDLLRKRMNFEGVVVTDIKDIQKLVSMHGSAANLKEAVYHAVHAGIDMNMACSSFDFITHLNELVEEGRITEARIDRSVKRILALKIRLGLMEQATPDEAHASAIGAASHKTIAEQAAAESMVLLKNQDASLPLGGDVQKIGLAGFAAHSKRLLNGPWTYEWMGAKEERNPEDMPTIYTAMQEEFPKKEIRHLQVPDFTSSKEKAAFKQKAGACDALVITVGEELYSEFKGNIENLRIGEEHRKLVALAAETNTPVAVILIEGRPRVINDIHENANAILFAGYPGIRGGTAIAGLLSGRHMPSGKLSFSYPSSVGHFTNYYRKKSQTYDPLYAFGHGLSYTEFAYSNLQLSDTLIQDAETPVKARVTVTNTGDRDAKETVLWYIRDEVGQITRPMKMLKKFEKALIPAGESKTFTFEFIPGETLSYPDGTGEMLLEKGAFRLMVKGHEEKFYYR